MRRAMLFVTRDIGYERRPSKKVQKKALLAIDGKAVLAGEQHEAPRSELLIVVAGNVSGEVRDQRQKPSEPVTVEPVRVYACASRDAQTKAPLVRQHVKEQRLE